MMRKTSAYTGKEEGMNNGGPYGRDYFENGIAQGISLYENYRWLPELTMRMAHFLVKRLGIEEGERVLDFGCAKGYLVKALRLFEIEAYGCDISPYAISRVDGDVSPYCRLSDTPDAIPFSSRWTFDWVIAKDVFEHLKEEHLTTLLTDFHRRCTNLFVVVPLGKNNKFVVPEYNRDTTHVLAKPAEWWKRVFYENGWFTRDFSHSFTALKENWVKRYPQGNGLFTLVRIKDKSR